MLSGIGERRISIRDRNVKAKNFPGAAIDVMYDYIKPLFKKRPDHITLHASTNNTVNKSSKTVLGKLLDLKKFIENTLPESTKQPSKGVFDKRCSGNMQQIYKKTPMQKCDFNNVAKQFYWNRTSAWVFSCKFTAYFQNSFL